MLVLAPAPSTWPLPAGSSVESERGTAADIVLHVVYLAGLFTFAIVLGVVTDDIGNAFDKV
jgi:hypothetical protein